MVYLSRQHHRVVSLTATTLDRGASRHQQKSTLLPSILAAILTLAALPGGIAPGFPSLALGCIFEKAMFAQVFSTVEGISGSHLKCDPALGTLSDGAMEGEQLLMGVAAARTSLQVSPRERSRARCCWNLGRGGR